MRLHYRAMILAVCAASASMARDVSTASLLDGRTYLPRTGFSIVSVIQPAPQPGEVRYEADREIFRRTRTLAGSQRWNRATSDVSEKPADMLGDFSCAAGRTLTPANAPKLTQLLVNASNDTATVNNEAKQYFHRARPFTIDKGPICQPASEVANSFDYPSGHTTRGWTWALVLARLLPDRAAQILARGREYGESRIVCGVHNASAVEAGRLSATVTMAAIEGDPRFLSDLKAARMELSRLNHGVTPDATECATEHSQLATAVKE
jgi:acid phosphatase (class A)